MDVEKGALAWGRSTFSQGFSLPSLRERGLGDKGVCTWVRTPERPELKS